MANYSKTKWYVVRLSDGITLSSAPSKDESDRLAAFFNEDAAYVVVTKVPGKLPKEQTFEQKVKQGKKDNDQRAASRRKVG